MKLAVAGFAARSRSTALPCDSSAFRVSLAENGLRAGLVERRAKEEFSGLAFVSPGQRRTAPHVAADRPARQHLGKRRHILLRVAAVHSKRVQLQDLAREVLVDADLPSHLWRRLTTFAA